MRKLVYRMMFELNVLQNSLFFKSSINSLCNDCLLHEVDLDTNIEEF